MANVNTSQAWNNISQVFTTATETAFVVPATGVTSQLPSPTLAAGVGLPLILDPDGQTQNATASPVVYTNSSIDGKEFQIRAIFKVTTAGAYTFIPKLYITTAATILAGTQGTVANDVLVATGSTFTAGGAGTYSYALTATFLWDSASQTLNGYFNSLVNGTFNATAATTQRTVTSPNNLNYILSGTFGTANAGNSVVISEWAFDRL